ncbi:DinB family protein [Robertkochia aurantiaca]|uniref:DinB family protein n=1 Tax=Robertkochia aurantiaca TaxID=2873700 RepID=UPI001CC9D997|nr:DinB family protein [Robertkochia sp. 3YJGBD-33]
MYLSSVKPNEYSDFYKNYIRSLDEVDLVEELRARKKVFNDLLKEVPAQKFLFAYAENKWTLAELILHITDAERVFLYRALRFARNDNTDLPGFDQDDYVLTGRANTRSPEHLLKEFNSVRDSSITLFESFDEEMLKRMGNANGFPMSVRAIGFVISGHQKHHEKYIRERYLADE